MMTKTVIIGTNHAGIAAANTLLDNYPDQEVVMIDRNSNLLRMRNSTLGRTTSERLSWVVLYPSRRFHK